MIATEVAKQLPDTDFKIALIVLPLNDDDDEFDPLFIADFPPDMLPEFLEHCCVYVKGKNPVIDEKYTSGED